MDAEENNSIMTWPLAESIEGLRIRLWCITLKDAGALADIMTPEVSRWLASWPANPAVEAVAERIKRAQKAMQENRELHFRIEERARNLRAGYVSVAQSATDCKMGDLPIPTPSAHRPEKVRLCTRSRSASTM